MIIVILKTKGRANGFLFTIKFILRGIKYIDANLIVFFFLEVFCEVSIFLRSFPQTPENKGEAVIRVQTVVSMMKITSRSKFQREVST